MKRFSLHSIFWVTGVVGLLLALVLLRCENSSLVREVNGLRSEMGHLVPIDYSRVNLVEVPTESDYIWRWRVFAPEGTCFDAGIMVGEIPRTGAPDPSPTRIVIPSVPSGVLLTASVTNHLDGEYLLTLDFSGGRNIQYRVHTHLPRDEWLDGSGVFSTAGSGGTQVCQYDTPIILHRRRLLEQLSPTTRVETDGDSRGMMFWITPRRRP